MSSSQGDSIRSPLDELATPGGDPLHPAKLKSSACRIRGETKRVGTTMVRRYSVFDVSKSGGITAE